MKILTFFAVGILVAINMVRPVIACLPESNPNNLTVSGNLAVVLLITLALSVILICYWFIKLLINFKDVKMRKELIIKFILGISTLLFLSGIISNLRDLTSC